jgi:hypothetical protein
MGVKKLMLIIEVKEFIEVNLEANNNSFVSPNSPNSC